MKLFYRGASYEHDPSRVGTGKKGQTYKQAEPQSTSNLAYRGVTYSVNENKRAIALSPMTNTKVKIPDVFTRQDRAKACRRIHQANILRNLQHRLQVAQERGDQTLIQRLEAELRQVAPSGPDHII